MKTTFVNKLGKAEDFGKLGKALLPTIPVEYFTKNGNKLYHCEIHSLGSVIQSKKSSQKFVFVNVEVEQSGLTTILMDSSLEDNLYEGDKLLLEFTGNVSEPNSDGKVFPYFGFKRSAKIRRVE